MIKRIKNKFVGLSKKTDDIKWVAQKGKTYKRKIIHIFLIGSLDSIIGIMISLIVKMLIDYASLGEFNLAKLISYGAVLIVAQLISLLWNYLSIDYDERVNKEIRTNLLDTILRSDWLNITKYKNGDLLTRVTDDVDKISDGISDLFPSFFTFAFQLVLTIGVLMFYNIAIAITALIMGLCGMVVCFLVKGKVYSLQQKVQEEESNSRSHVIESCADIAFVKSYRAEKQTVDMYGQIQQRKFDAVKKLAVANSKTSFAMNFIFNVSYLVAFGLGIYFLSSQQISYGTLSLYIVLANRVQSPMLNMAHSIPRMIWMLSSAHRIKEIENISLERGELSPLPKGKYGISVKDVNFAYFDDTPVLNNISFDVAPGEIVGIVGQSGSGKTTLIRLVLSLLKAKSGSVEFVSEQGERFGACVNTRQLIGYVPQGNMSVAGTIRDNICFGIGKDVEDDKIIKALKIADAYDFVMSSKNGLDTVISEGGLGLSQGQAQRIAIARAFITDAPIIIMDEATSALDADTEKKILNNISNLENKPTCLFITHRKDTLEICDRVLKVSKGGIN